MFALSDLLRINAWTGAESPSAQPALKWGLKRRMDGPSADDGKLAGPAKVTSESNWRHPAIGWGLVLPDNDELDAAARATADDAPHAIQELVAARNNAPVFRYVTGHQGGFLRRYFSDGKFQDPSLAGSAPGIARGQLPRYLLIYAPPERIPWRFQYVANSSTFVGRIWLEGDALTNYVNALLKDWSDTPSNPLAPVVWSVNLGEPDITWLMDTVISKRLRDRFAEGELTEGASMFNDDATAAALASALAKHTPSLIASTSHGMTGPLSTPAQMNADLGMPVGVDHDLVRPETLLDGWAPNGAIWYAHACCSAGSDASSRYAGLFDPGSSVATTLAGVAATCQDRVAPLPTALLGAKHPLRAFAGHVEPTFDWTLRNPETGQPLAHAIVDALYTRLYQQGEDRMTLGHALTKVYAEAGAFLAQHAQALEAVNQGAELARERALYRQLVAMDRQQLVILGDPTVMLPPLP
ncbi:MAG: hypothetical protein MNPFHGCM_00268 [Gemmatimonadaceae bacterium]|nr:hypothetical protein [Gemmatimonadaceae bacterium]